jgi:hypothetical protein
VDRRGFLRTACGPATAFVAMNDVFGPLFDVDRAEGAPTDAAAARQQSLEATLHLTRLRGKVAGNAFD